MHFVSARLLEGAAPYRDVFDMNFPAVYLLHALVLVVVGGGDAGFRAFDLALLAGGAAGLAAALAPFGRWAAVSGPTLFWLYHVAGGAWRAGQRDLVLCLPLAWLAAALTRAGAPGPGRLAAAGAALGVAVWVKPHAVLLAPLLAALAWQAPPARRGRALAAAAVAAALPGLALLLWLAAVGALPAFADIVVRYLAPLYGPLARVSPLAALRGQALGIPVVAGLGLWALGGLTVLGRDRRAAVLAAGLGYGALHYVVQGKGWEYHLYPFALFAAAAGAAGLGVAVAAGRRVAAGLLLGLLALSSVALGAKGAGNLEPAWIAAKVARARAAAAALAPIVERGGLVQVLDTTEGGIHALYLAGGRQPTRFLYDFHFYHDVEHPYVQGLRRELLAGLRARPPAAVLLLEQGWPAGGYDRIHGFPELAAWLAAGYRLASAGDGFRVYAARSDR
jgi:hypothetical protein